VILTKMRNLKYRIFGCYIIIHLDERYGQDYLHSKEGTHFKLLMDRVMNCLLNRHAVEVSMRYPYGGYEMMVYRKTLWVTLPY